MNPNDDDILNGLDFTPEPLRASETVTPCPVGAECLHNDPRTLAQAVFDVVRNVNAEVVETVKVLARHGSADAADAILVSHLQTWDIIQTELERLLDLAQGQA